MLAVRPTPNLPLVDVNLDASMGVDVTVGYSAVKLLKFLAFVDEKSCTSFSGSAEKPTPLSLTTSSKGTSLSAGPNAPLSEYAGRSETWARIVRRVKYS